jgi:Domain of unknown function (DUF1707)
VPVTTGPEDPRAGRHRLRAGHTDREHAIEALKTAFVDGRLTKNELAARTGRALVSRTYADLAALTDDIPAEPTAAEPFAAVPVPAEPAAAPAIRRPLAKAAAISGVCLGIAAAAIEIGGHLDAEVPGPNPDHSWVAWCFLLALVAVMVALLAVGLGVATSIEQRRSRRQLPPRPGPGGHAPDGERHDGTSHDPGSRTDHTRTDMRARESRPPRPRIPAWSGRAPGGVSPAPGTA